jgi:predicted enzyme related to lactoylglutathione lyase
MRKRDRYPAGVPCWVDTSQPDPQAAADFYGELLGWTMTNVMPPEAPAPYFEATLDGGRVAAVGSAEGSEAPTWETYIAVASADEAAERVRANGGKVLAEPFDIFTAGRMAVCADPEGATFSVWQAGEHFGAEVVNAPGSWNWSALNTRDPEGAKRFYGAVFGWEFDATEYGSSILVRRPGYGDYLDELNPGTKARHAEGGAPPGFSDAVAWFDPIQGEGTPRWSVTFTIDDADAAAARAKELGGTVLVEPFDVPWQRLAVIRDPQGAHLTLGQFKPPTE